MGYSVVGPGIAVEMAENGREPKRIQKQRKKSGFEGRERLVE